MQLGKSGSLRRRRNGGFTLVELIVVLIIIAATAGLVIPAVAMLGRSTDMAVSADSQAALANNIQEFFILQKRYPQGMDSLLQVGAAGATSGVPDGLYVKVTDATGQQVSGMSDSSPNILGLLIFDNTTINDVGSIQFRRSFTRGGFDWVNDHQSYDFTGPAGEPNANISGKIRRGDPSTGLPAGAVAVARLKGTVVGDPALSSANLDILRRIVPSEFNAAGTYTPESGTHLVALGIGPNCRLVPTTMINTPIYPGCDGKYYGRYIAIFKVFASGERPILITVMDCNGRTPDYTQQQFNESLPNGGRQG